MKKYLFYFLLFALSFNAFKVTAQRQLKKHDFSTLEVVSPITTNGSVTASDPQNGVSFVDDDKVQIIIKFSREVITSSVIVGSTLLLAFAKEANADATLSWSDGNKTLTVITKKKFSDLKGATTDQFFRLTLKGTAGIKIGVQATNSHYLYGNGKSEKEGGTYNLYYTFIN